MSVTRKSLEILGGVARTEAGQVDPYYGPYPDAATAYAAIPAELRPDKIFGIVESGVTVTYQWNVGGAYANGDEQPFGNGGGGGGGVIVDTVLISGSPNAAQSGATYAAVDTLTTAVAAKADSATVTAALATKADTSALTPLQPKVTASITNSTASIVTGDLVEAALGKAQGQIDAHTTAIATKANTSALTPLQPKITSNITPSTTPMATGDTVEVALGKAQGQLAAKADTASIDSSAIIKPELGLLFSDNFTRGSVGGNYVGTGPSTYAIVSNALQITSAAATYTPLASYLLYTAYAKSQVESFTATMKIVAGTISSTSFGVGLILKGGGTYPSTVSVTLRMDTANLGKVQFDDANGAAVLGLKAIAITAGDTLYMTVRYVRNKFIVKIQNGLVAVTTEYIINTAYTTTALISLPSTYQFGITAPGGVHTVDDFAVSSNDVVGVDILFDGDSILHGYYVDNIQNRAIEQINSISNTVTQAHAGAGSSTGDVNMAEIVALAPKKLVLQKIINDIGSIGSDATCQTNYAAYVASAVSAGFVLGTTLFLTIPFPNNTLNTRVNTFITWQKANYPAAALIDCNTSFLNSANTGYDTSYSFDGTHLNNAGNDLLADIHVTFFGLPSKPKKTGDNQPVVIGASGFVGIMSKFFKGLLPKTLLELIGAGTQLHLADNSSDGGLYLAGNGNDFSISANLKNGLATFSGGYKLSTNGTLLRAQYFTGATIGSAPTLLDLFYGAANQIKFGAANIGPKAVVHIAPGGTAANSGAFKIDPGSLLTTTEAGAIEPTTTDIYYTGVAAAARFRLSRQVLSFPATATGDGTTKAFAVTWTSIGYIPVNGKFNAGNDVSAAAAWLSGFSATGATLNFVVAPILSASITGTVTVFAA